MRQTDVIGWKGKADNVVRYGFYVRYDTARNILVRHVKSAQGCQVGEDCWFAAPFEVYTNVR